MKPITDKREETAIEFLGSSPKEWGDLLDRKIGAKILVLAPLVSTYQSDLRDIQRFWLDLNEVEVVPKVEKNLRLLDELRVAVIDIVAAKETDDQEIIRSLAYVWSKVSTAYTLYAKAESKLLDFIRSNSIGGPREGSFTKDVSNYWNYIDGFWADKGKDALKYWDVYFRKAYPMLVDASARLTSMGKTANGVLYSVESLLRKRSSNFAAQLVADANESVTQYYVEEEGLIPAYMGRQGSWKVAKDDCRDTRLPERGTKLTSSFAFCRLKVGRATKECPSFSHTRGSYVKCKSFIMLKEGNLAGTVKELKSKSVLSSLEKMAETDPHIRSLLKEAKRRKSGKLYYSVVIDGRLEDMLSQYLKSSARGNHTYRVYVISGEPVVVSGKNVVSASKELLEIISKGDRMPKTAHTVKTAEPVIRVTFTANALRDPEFRDFLRKHKGLKSWNFTYDIPFSTEEDIRFFLNEVREEFGYKIEIFEIVEDADSYLSKDFGLYQFSSFPISRMGSYRLDLTYIPNVPDKKYVTKNSFNLEAASKLEEVSGKLSDNHKGIRERVSYLASSLKAKSSFLVVPKRDIVRYASGAIGILPDIGSHWVTRLADGSDTTVELISIRRSKKRLAANTSYTVRRIDTGEELRISNTWVKTALRVHIPNRGRDMPNMGMPPMGPPMIGMPPMDMPPMDMPPMDMPPMESLSLEIPESDEFSGDTDVMHPLGLPPMADIQGPGPSLPSSKPLHELVRNPSAPLPPALPPWAVQGPEAPTSTPPPSTVQMDTPPAPMGAPGLPPSDNAFGFSRGEDTVYLFKVDPPAGDIVPKSKEDSSFGRFPGDAPIRVPAIGDREEHGPVTQGEDVYVPTDSPEKVILDDIKEKTKPGNPGFKFNTPHRDPIAPSGTSVQEVQKATKKLRNKYKGDPRVKNISSSLGPDGKPVLYLHCTMPKAMAKAAPSSVNGIRVVPSLFHSSLEEGNEDECCDDIDDTDRTYDSLTRPNQPTNGKPPRGFESGPEKETVSAPAPWGSPVLTVDKDFPVGS